MRLLTHLPVALIAMRALFGPLLLLLAIAWPNQTIAVYAGPRRNLAVEASQDSYRGPGACSRLTDVGPNGVGSCTM